MARGGPSLLVAPALWNRPGDEDPLKCVLWTGSQESGEAEEGREGGQERPAGASFKILEKMIH